MPHRFRGSPSSAAARPACSPP
ncbi:NAD(FAD)-utilizing dehydrogenase, partial [Stenotrophomonas maltophilia]